MYWTCSMVKQSLMVKVSSNLGYPLRPELIESTYYLYSATGNPLYLEVAEKMMNDIES